MGSQLGQSNDAEIANRRTVADTNRFEQITDRLPPLLAFPRLSGEHRTSEKSEKRKRGMMGRKIGNYLSPPQSFISRELNQQRPRRTRMRHLKSEFALLQTLSRLFHLVQNEYFWSWILKDCIEVQEKKKVKKPVVCFHVLCKTWS